ncbi:MAG: hypothetical protein IJF92_00145 [Bacilli bacterium]|nr:hypothetical protein [Bacilli bacterium]MBQ3307600.1 hypothetical protein [Bacilli bacterium]
MALLNNYIKVKELTDNMQVDGMLEKYDDTSPYMFCKIIDIDADALNKITSKTDMHNNQISMSQLFKSVIVVKRVTKIRGFKGYYIQLSDIIEIIPSEEYDKYVFK